MSRSLNGPDLKIWTAEDPIEITRPGLLQVRVHSKIDGTFAPAMKHLVRTRAALPEVVPQREGMMTLRQKARLQEFPVPS